MNEDTFAFPHFSSGLLFISAKTAAKRAKGMFGRIGEQTEAITAVVLSVMAAEAGINEIVGWFEIHGEQAPFQLPHSLPSGFEKRNLRDKWQQLPRFARSRTFDEGVEPWQSFDALVNVRNALVHRRQGSPSKDVKRFLVERRLVKDESCFLGFEVARWSCDTVTRMFAKLTELVEPPTITLDLTWLWTPTHSFPPGLSTPGDPFDEDLVQVDGNA